MQGRMRSEFPSYIQTVSNRVEENTKANQLNVEADISSLAMALTQNFRSMFARTTEHVDRDRQDVLDLDEAESSK